MTQPIKMTNETSKSGKLLQDKVIPGFKHDQPNISGKVASSEESRWPQEGSERLPSESSILDSVSATTSGNRSSALTSAGSKSSNPSEISSSTNSCQVPMQSLTSMPNIDNLKAHNSMNQISAGDKMNVDVAVVGTPVFTYKDLALATNGFDDCRKIGEGAFGKVYYGVLRNCKCAIKRLEEVGF